MATMVYNRCSTFGIGCVRCDEVLIAPEKSEYRDDVHIRHQWLCPKCATRFESIEQIPVEVMTADDILPSLVVA
jgi:hypothetical protein